MSHDSSIFLSRDNKLYHWEHNTFDRLDLYQGPNFIVSFSSEEAEKMIEQAEFLLDLYHD